MIWQRRGWVATDITSKKISKLLSGLVCAQILSSSVRGADICIFMSLVTGICSIVVALFIHAWLDRNKRFSQHMLLPIKLL